MDGLSAVSRSIMERMTSIVFFLAAAGAVILFPLLLFVVPFLLVPVLIHRFIVFHKIKYRALEDGDREGSDVVTAQVIDLESWKKYKEDQSFPMSSVDPAVAAMARAQINEINARELQEITDLLPSTSATTQYFTEVDVDKWVYSFHSYGLNAEFNAVTYGHDPAEAFAMAKAIIMQQIREWHVAREKGEPYVGQANEDLLKDIRALGKSTKPSLFSRPSKHVPSVLIVEDDPEVAAATEAVFKQLGCETTISNGHDGVPYKMSFQNYDFIVLDWMLGDDLVGNQLVEKSVKIIDLFNDLKARFEHNRPKVITYSVLDRPQVQLPTNNYFYHLDHWRKPTRYSDLAVKASELISANAN
jgi:CheY-like chemotaxis protein